MAVLLVSAVAMDPLRGCCCKTPVDSITDTMIKTVYGCKDVNCGLVTAFECSACFDADISEACRFCKQTTQRLCARAPSCAAWCPLTNHCRRFAACLGCTSCEADEAGAPPGAPPPVHAPRVALCQHWCEAHPADWSRKCIEFEGCKGCSACHQSATNSLVQTSKLRTTSDTTSDLDLFLANLGIPVLPVARVTYRFYKGPQLVTTNVEGYSTRLSEDDDALLLHSGPSSMSWAHVPGFSGPNQRQLAIMMDLDAGGRTSADGDSPGTEGISVLGFWTDCTEGTLASCRTLIPYIAGAGPQRGTHRYAFMVLQQPTSYLRAVGHVTAFEHWDFGAFLSANWPEWWSERFDEGKDFLCPAVAANLMYVSKTREEAALDPRRFPPWGGSPPSPPPKPPQSPYPPPPPPEVTPSPPPRPAATWWGGSETLHPWEQGYVAAPLHVDDS
eukprot:CAMPEP_0115844690 /NCGR_PEP_ID=MMETSP0287-20121206/8957_1 /TAXON_ID=412157 /ORGANISM="Chrysochromulina rotalis, Strain UIO044" /LENGTH=443 /DNA_ID=CAMNT_0003298421 /DNA_START=5 /DNA_END=1336 /DNA_ORIENTATION=+